MFVVQIAMYHYDMYVKVAYNNFDNKQMMMMMMKCMHLQYIDSYCKDTSTEY